MLQFKGKKKKNLKEKSMIPANDADRNMERL